MRQKYLSGDQNQVEGNGYKKGRLLKLLVKRVKNLERLVILWPEPNDSGGTVQVYPTVPPLPGRITKKINVFMNFSLFTDILCKQAIFIKSSGSKFLRAVS